MLNSAVIEYSSNVQIGSLDTNLGIRMSKSCTTADLRVFYSSQVLEQQLLSDEVFGSHGSWVDLTQPEMMSIGLLN
jgi:hypothetical protein